MSVIAIVASGCLSSDVDIVIDEDRSGSVDVEVVVPSDIREALEAARFDELAAATLESVPGARLESVRRLGKRTYNLHIPFEDYRSLSDNLLAGTDLMGQRISLFSHFELTELSDGGYRLLADTRPLGEVATFAENEVGLSLAAAFGLMTAEGEGTGMHLSVRLPGRVVSSNATTVVDDVATWDLRGADESHHLEMTTESVPLLSQLQWVLLATGGVFVVGMLFMFFGARGPARRRGRKKKDYDRRAIIPPERWDDPWYGIPRAESDTSTKQKRTGSR